MTSYQGRGLHGQTVERLGVLIVGGTYKQGDPMLAERLERDLDVSKTVVREALKVLAAKGLVESRQKRGTVVRPRQDWNLLDADVLRWQSADRQPDFAFLEDLAEVRAIIEPAAARLAATRRTDADLKALEDALNAMASAGDDADAIVAADTRFHRATLEATHNELLRRMEVVLISGLQVRDQFVHHSRLGSDPMPAHRAVFDAIAGADADEAGKAVETLLEQARRDLAKSRRNSEKAVPRPRRRR